MSIEIIQYNYIRETWEDIPNDNYIILDSYEFVVTYSSWTEILNLYPTLVLFLDDIYYKPAFKTLNEFMIFKIKTDGLLF